MRKLLPIALAAVVALTSAASLAQKAAAEKTKVSVLALEIQKGLPKKTADQFKFYGSNPGTKVTLHLAVPGKSIVELDDDASKILAFTDDKGTNLAKRRRGSFGGMSLRFPKISEDGHDCMFDVSGDQVPAAEAKEIRLKARIVAKCGAGMKTVRQDGVALKARSKITVGPVPMTIKKTGRPKSDGFTDFDLPGDRGKRAKKKQKPAMSVELEIKTTRKELAKIKDIKFLDGDGKEIKSTSTGSTSTWMGQNVTAKRGYNLYQKVGTATVEVTYFERMESITIPVDVTIGVGL